MWYSFIPGGLVSVSQLKFHSTITTSQPNLLVYPFRNTSANLSTAVKVVSGFQVDVKQSIFPLAKEPLQCDIVISTFKEILAHVPSALNLIVSANYIRKSVNYDSATIDRMYD